MRLTPLQLEFEDLPDSLPGVQERWEAVLESWRRTPYASGQRLRGVAADCVGGVFGSIDDLDGRQRAQDPSLPADTALHDPRTAYRAVAAIRRIYAPAKRLRLGGGRLVVQPADLLVVGTSCGGPGHLMTVGARKNTIWHASNSSDGFCQTGWALGSGFERLFAVYRLDDRERWVR